MHKIELRKHPSLRALGGIFLGLVLSAQAEAHVLLEVPQAVQGSLYKAVFRVPHGCHGLATTALKVEIPEGISGAKPMPKPGWTLSTAKGAREGKAESVTSVTWSGGNLPDDEYDEFIMLVHVTDTLAPGFTVYFPAEQKCGDETESWTDVPQSGQASGELKRPAPGLHILAAMTPAPSAVLAGSLQIETPWLRATPGGAKVAGGYLTITNNGTEPDRLMSAALPIAPKGEVHEMSMDNGTMHMRELAEGLEIPPGKTVKLAPGGYHIMFENLTEPLKQGDMVEGALVFAKAGKVTVSFKVGGIADTAPPPSSSDAAHEHMH